MIYETRIITPKNTPITAPLEATLLVHPGHIQQVSVEFPSGCCGLVGVAIDLWSHQLWPANPDAWFSGDGAVLTFPEDLELVDRPFQFSIRVYNLDDTYPHGQFVRVQIVPFGQSLVDIMRMLAVGPSGPVTVSGG